MNERSMPSAAAVGLIGLLALGGCATQPVPGDPAFAPAAPVVAPIQAQPTGSLYRAGYSMYLFENAVARQVGDILTIELMEKTDAKKKADTGIKKDSDSTFSASLGTSGLQTQPWSADLDLGAERDFDGSGESEQSNSLEGNISVVVYQVLPNGNLMVRGEKWLNLNQGEEFIRISGIVRPADISPDNTVPSFLVADARISYSGTGPVADANKLGWLARFFVSALLPF